MPYTFQAICFDLDDTLWPVQPVIQYSERVLHHWLSLHYPKIAQQFSIEQFYRMRQHLLQQQPELKHDLAALRKLSLTVAAKQVGYSEQLVEPAFEVFQTARHQVNFYQDVLPALERLHRNYALCAVTNGTAEIGRVGLGHLFEIGLTAGQVGAAKPEPALFLAICDYLEVCPRQVVHVGDDPICDVGGAAALGMRTVWLNRQRKPWIGQHSPDQVIYSLSELENILQIWEQ